MYSTLTRWLIFCGFHADYNILQAIHVKASKRKTYTSEWRLKIFNRSPVRPANVYTNLISLVVCECIVTRPGVLEYSHAISYCGSSRVRHYSKCYLCGVFSSFFYQNSECVLDTKLAMNFSCSRLRLPEPWL